MAGSGGGSQVAPGTGLVASLNFLPLNLESQRQKDSRQKDKASLTHRVTS
jgi:hypothetical protein